MSSSKLIVGLGNPGDRYSDSRHNVGFLVVDAFAALRGFPAPARVSEVEATEARIEGARVVLVKPQGYMNRSGPALREFLARCSPLDGLDETTEARRGGGEGARPLADEVLVVHDDLDLPFGKVRFRAAGSSGGHRGVESLIEELSTGEFGRLRVGIGRKDGAEVVDYVLERLEGREKTALVDVAARVAETLLTWIREGIVACANRYNGSAGEFSPTGSE